MANCCAKTKSFFGVVQQIYSLFSSSTKRWKIFKDYVEGFTLEPLSETCWENRVENIKAIRYQAPQIRDALAHLVETSEDLKTKSEVDSIVTYEFENFEFMFGMDIWYNLLFAINYVSKILQNEDMHIDVAIKQLKSLISYLEKYIEIGFEEAMIDAKEIASEMKIKAVFHEKRIIRRKKQFDDNANEDAAYEDMTQSDIESFKVNYFIYIVEQTLSSLKNRLEQFQNYEETFEFLYDLRKLKSVNIDSLKNYCFNLEALMKHDGVYNINGKDLFSELQILKNG
ncbi:hypothetical protein Ddye_008293 [Dipteronia dyeriana]|uniref:Uncharacterized protein n=1 Tax=Dipteronia dyeriana TaxID=168575 RepID=A0AAE0CL87_9ROSI|nr:hypothetical protein Ddye_008293 [Dipteronia dyeriana]